MRGNYKARFGGGTKSDSRGTNYIPVNRTRSVCFAVLVVRCMRKAMVLLTGFALFVYFRVSVWAGGGDGGYEKTQARKKA